MAPRRPSRVMVSMVLAALLLTVSPWARSGVLADPVTQTLSMTVLNSGILTVTAASTVTWTYPDPADLGKLTLKNTLNDSFDWTVTAAITDLRSSSSTGSCSNSSTDCIPFTNIQLTTSTTFGTVPEGSSTTGLVRGPSGPFIGTDGTPGTLSAPKQVLMADHGLKGTYTQGDSSLANDNSIQQITLQSLESGTYSGTVQYTITG